MQMEKPQISFLPFETTDINEPSVVPYQKKINESPETIAKSLELLRQELTSLKDIDPCLDDSFLLMFLRVSKFDSQKALQRILNYYQQCDTLCEAFAKTSISLQKAQSINYLSFAPFRPKNNSVLLIATNRTLDYRKITFGERFYLETVTVFRLLLENPLNQICGATCIIDLTGFNIHSLLACTPRWMRTFLNFTVSAVPCRVKAIHIVNVPEIFSSLFNMVNALLPIKIRDRVFLHSGNDGWSNLHASIPAEILPKQYGGKINDEEMISYLKDLKELEETFLKLFAFGTLKNQRKRKSMRVLC